MIASDWLLGFDIMVQCSTCVLLVLATFFAVVLADVVETHVSSKFPNNVTIEKNDTDLLHSQ